jgi:hypothetical protein
MIEVCKKDFDAWQSFVLSCRQGKQPCVQSAERREAILALDDFVEKCRQNGSLLVGEGGDRA